MKVPAGKMATSVEFRKVAAALRGDVASYPCILNVADALGLTAERGSPHREAFLRAALSTSWFTSTPAGEAARETWIRTNA
jgi:hypothetical protein